MCRQRGVSGVSKAGSLEKTDEEANGEEVVGCLDAVRGQSADSPAELERRNDPSRADASKEEVDGDLSHAVSCSPYTGGMNKLIPVHVEVLLHARDEGGGNVGLIQVL